MCSTVSWLFNLDRRRLTSKKKYRVPLVFAWHTKSFKKSWEVRGCQVEERFRRITLTHLKIRNRSRWCTVVGISCIGGFLIRMWGWYMEDYWRKILTVGHPVSAIYIVGLLDMLWASSTSFCWKKSAVQPAAADADWFANQGWTFASWSSNKISKYLAKLEHRLVLHHSPRPEELGCWNNFQHRNSQQVNWRSFRTACSLYPEWKKSTFGPLCLLWHY